MKNINVGDKVSIFWINGDKLSGIVENIPADTGDMWYIKGESGTIHVVNPMCSNLEQIVKY